MFGYVYINKPELKIREFDRYRAHYCGLCRGLKQGSGFFGRLTLNYDMTFLVMVLTSLYEPELKISKRRCIAHPFVKHEEITSEITEYAADMNVLLAYYNLMDDWKDERKILRRAYAFLLQGKVRRIEKKYPEKAEKIKICLSRISEIEKQSEKNIDIPACTFGEIMAEIFSYDGRDPMAESLRNCGFYLGKFIYMLDAYEDIEEDIRKNSYNPFREIYKEEDFEKRAFEMLTGSISASAREFERLPLIDDVEIMRNIIYAGCWVRYEQVKEKRINGSI